MGLLACNALGHHHALVLALVREHRAAHDIAHRPDPGHARLAVVVHGNEASGIDSQPQFLQAEALGVGLASHGHNQPIAFQGLRLALGVGVRHLHALLGCVDLADGNAHVNGEALLGEELEGLLADGLIAGGQKLGCRLQDRDLCAQAAPDRAQLQANHTGTNHTESLRRLRKLQCALVVADGDVVDGHAWQVPGLGSCGDDKVLGQDSVALDDNLNAIGRLVHNGGVALEPRDFVLAE